MDIGTIEKITPEQAIYNLSIYLQTNGRTIPPAFKSSLKHCLRLLAGEPLGYRKPPDRPEREEIARWLFKNTDIISWDLCGHELNECITEYEQLLAPPEGCTFETEDLEILKGLRNNLLESADQIIALFADNPPVGKPPLLGDEEIEVAKKEAERLSWTHKAHPRFEKEKYLLQAQREADIKFYEGY